MLNKKVISVFLAGCSLLLFTVTNVSAGIIDLSGYGPNYLEIVETQSNVEGLIILPRENPNDPLDWYWGVVGSRITYDIYNNTNYTITGFAVGVDSSAGSDSDDEESLSGWSGFVANRWESNHGLNSFWEDGNYLSEYNYAYYGQVYEQVFEPGNPDYSPPGDPLDPYTGIVDEFSFTFDDGTAASPLIIFATNSLGEEVTLLGESSHVLGENRLYVSGGPAPVPVPTTILLFGLGLLGLSGISRKRKQ